MAKRRTTIGSATQANGPNSSGFRPSDFMRARRPELFSDSKVSRGSKLPQAVLEYHLGSLTSRKQEGDFEHFCRRLAEKKLCPNLLPQTGPVGGGDSKVDSENYPVADEISMRWYEGRTGSGRTEQRWAFAFSAKQAWRAKADSDVRKIAETKRGYNLVYFLTNQFVKDKVRAEVETALSKRYKVQARILDRSWILKCVFEDDLVGLAVETLHLTGFEADHKRTGPRDVKRQQELGELEKQIADTERYRGVEYQLGEDCIQAALLARGLELPRVEIEGRFLRAEGIARRLGHRQQQLRIAYAKAWTAYFWFDDFRQFVDYYGPVEELALGSGNASDVELLANIWSLLAVTVRDHGFDALAAELESRTHSLRAELERLAADKERLNNALWARTNLLLMELQERPTDAGAASRLFTELKPIVAQVEGLISYPVEAVSRIVTELGDVLGSNPHYDDLFELLADIMRRRASDGEAGRMLLARAHQKLRNRKIYDAIRLYGRAQLMLAKREYRLELIAALVGGGLAYESAGLLWAARASILAAANQAFSEYLEHGEILPQALVCLRKLVWIELQLGRVPSVLQWIEMASIVAQNIGLTGKRREAYLEERTAQDGTLGILFLRSDIDQLWRLDALPPALDRLGLDLSRMALLYALGYEDRLREEGTIPAEESHEGLRETFTKWITQPSATDLPAKPNFPIEDEVLLRSSVLGCQVTARVANEAESIYLGERILAALESLLATSIEGGAFSDAQEFTMRIKSSGSVVGHPDHSFEASHSGQVLVVNHAAAAESRGTRVNADAHWLQGLVVEIALRIAVPRNPEQYAEQVFGREVGLGRAITFSDTSIPVTNILGDKPRLRISDWGMEGSDETFLPQRRAVWSDGLDLNPQDRQASRMFDKLADGDPPKELLDFSDIKHSEVRVFSLIERELWERANWRAMGYAFDADLQEPPILALAFGNAEAAREIFNGWRGKLGDVDREEQLRLSIVTGIDKKHPFSYAVVIGSNPSILKDSGFHHFVNVSRICRMDPPDSKNLNAFLVRFERIGRYMLVPAVFSNEFQQQDFQFDLWIGKRSLRVVPAWQLGKNDPDGVALRPDDDPIIPDGVQDAPVTALLERKAAWGQASGTAD